MPIIDPLCCGFAKVCKLIFFKKRQSSEVCITAQKMNFSVSKYGQIRRKLGICSHLLEKSLMKNFIFCVVHEENDRVYKTTILKANYENMFTLMVLTKFRLRTANLRTTF